MTSPEHEDLTEPGGLDLELGGVLADPEPVRARDIRVDKLYRARCLRRPCSWTGSEHAAYQDANDERLAHLNQHILGGL